MKRYVKAIMLFASILILSQSVTAQAGKVPPFRMVQGNGKVFRAEDLPLGKPILLIYFSPDCEDCQKFTTGVTGRINDFKDVSIAMITYQPVENVSKYVAKNRLYSYVNIFTGTEGSSLFVRNYYNITKFPFVVLYNKYGDLIMKYPANDINLDDLVGRIRALNKK